MRITAPAPEIMRTLQREAPGWAAPEGIRCELLSYQLLALYLLARRYDRAGARILEIGTGQGGATFALSRAARRAEVTTLEPDPERALAASGNLRRARCGNVELVDQASWDYLQAHADTRWDLVWVDGDHNAIARDMPWFNWLTVGGLFLCHDYSPAESARPSPVVYATLRRFAETLGRPPDVELVDETLTGMAGWYQREGESWQG